MYQLYLNYVYIQFQKILKEVGRIVKIFQSNFSINVYFSIEAFLLTSKHLKSVEIVNNESSTIVT